jgi:hypothetical protein
MPLFIGSLNGCEWMSIKPGITSQFAPSRTWSLSAIIMLADKGDAVFGHHDVDAGSVDVRLVPIVPLRQLAREVAIASNR